MAVEAGADHIGVLVGDGEFPRELSIDEAKEVFAAVPEGIKKVALSLARHLEPIENIITWLKPDIIHLGTVPDGLFPADIEALRADNPDMEIMRSIPVVGEEAIGLARQYDGSVDYLLLDTHLQEDNQIGATGETHDWNISKAIVDSVNIPVILAGGLGPDNVAEAIRQVHPAGVDSKTQTDKEDSHEKDPDKVRRFIEEAKKAAKEERLE